MAVLYSMPMSLLHCTFETRANMQIGHWIWTEQTAWAVLGALVHSHRHWTNALEQYERAYAYQTVDPIILHGYAELLLQLGRIDEAKAMMR